MRSNFRSEMQNLFNPIVKKYHDMGEKYDNETNHGANKEEQAKWNTFFEEKLQQYQTLKS